MSVKANQGCEPDDCFHKCLMDSFAGNDKYWRPEDKHIYSCQVYVMEGKCKSQGDITAKIEVPYPTPILD